MRPHNLNPLDVVKDISSYYALGTPNLAFRHEGFQSIHKIVGSKIEAIQADNLIPWKNIILFLSDISPLYEIFDYSFHQTPSLLVDINQLKIENEHFEYKKGFTIIISLLTNIFTMYNYEKFSPIVEDKLMRGNKSSIYIKSIEPNIYFEEIFNEIQNNFKICQFSDYKDLFKIKIHGTVAYNMNFDDYFKFNAQGLPLGAFVFGFDHHFAEEVNIIE